MTPTALLPLILSVPVAAAPASVLLCAPARCAEELATLPALGFFQPVASGDLLLELDAVGEDPELPGARFQRHLQAAVTEARAARWPAAGRAASAAEAALAEYPGNVLPDDLFALAFVRAAALRQAGDPAWVAWMNGAVVALDGGLPGSWPNPDNDLRTAFLEARRELEATGRGQLHLAPLPEGGRWWIDGKAVKAGSHALLAGSHRVTARGPQAARTWVFAATVLPERSSTIPAPDSLLAEGDAGWMLARLEDAFSTLQAPPAVTDRLAEWCARQGIDRLQLIRLVEGAPTLPELPAQSEAPPTRPDAAAGETRDYGEAVPGTWEAHLADRAAEAGQRSSWRDPQIEVLVFDPLTRRFAVELRAPAPVPAAPKLRLGLHLGWAALMQRENATLELSLDLGRSWLQGELRLGLMRASTPWSLAPGWQDRQLYRGFLGGRLSPLPDARLRPSLALGGDLIAPVGVGLRAIGGLAWSATDTWAVGAEASGAVGSAGSSAGAGMSLLGSF